MKTASAELDAHFQQEVTTLTTCWRITRLDLEQFHFTEHDKNIPFDIDGLGTSATYKASSSYNRSAIKNDDTLAVDNLDLTGVLALVDVDETDLRRGLFDYAVVEIFMVNWEDLTQGAMKLRKGRLGEATITGNGLFFAELRGLTQAYSRRIGELYTPECRVDLGDERCKVPILPEIAVRNKAYAVGDFVRASSSLEGVPVATVLAPYDVDANDDSVNAATGTLGAQAAIQTVEKKFGAGSVEFSPSGSVNPSASFVSYPDITAYTIGSNKFTIEFHTRFKDLTAAFQVMASHYLNTGDDRSWRVARFNNTLDFFLSDDGTSVSPAVAISGAFTWVVDTWYHVALTRDASNDVRMFVDGVQVGSTTNVSFALHDSSAPLRIGKFRSVSDDSPMNGFVDNFRVTIGEALYTANFTPPAAAFPSISDVITDLGCTDFDDRIYVATTAGTSDIVVQPVYDTTIGNTTTDGSAIFTAEDAWSRCITVNTVDGADPRKKFEVIELTPNSGGGTSGRSNFPDDSMNGGVVVWETGDNAGTAMEVRDFIADDGITITQDLELFLDMPFDIVVGDTARIYRGCFKRPITDCKDVFDNMVNFRGEPYIPGQDAIFSYPDAKA